MSCKRSFASLAERDCEFAPAASSPSRHQHGTPGVVPTRTAAHRDRRGYAQASAPRESQSCCVRLPNHGPPIQRYARSSYRTWHRGAGFSRVFLATGERRWNRAAGFSRRVLRRQSAGATTPSDPLGGISVCWKTDRGAAAPPAGDERMLFAGAARDGGPAVRGL